MNAIAHRGCPDDNPENTVAAFRTAATVADAVECDVRRCGSDELVVFHDETLSRLTDASGRVEETALSTLRTLDVDGSGEPIPLLEDVLDAVPADTAVITELKSRGIAEEVVAAGAAVPNDVIVSSFQPPALRTAATAGASSLSVLAREDFDAALSLAAALPADSLDPPIDACIETNLVGRAHDRGLRVNPWTADTRADVDRLAAAGADGVSTDSMDVLEYVY